MRTAFTCRIYNKIEEVFEPRNKGKSTIEITDFRTITGFFFCNLNSRLLLLQRSKAVYMLCNNVFTCDRTVSCL